MRLHQVRPGQGYIVILPVKVVCLESHPQTPSILDTDNPNKKLEQRNTFELCTNGSPNSVKKRFLISYNKTNARGCRVKVASSVMSESKKQESCMRKHPQKSVQPPNRRFHIVMIRSTSFEIKTSLYFMNCQHSHSPVFVLKKMIMESSLMAVEIDHTTDWWWLDDFKFGPLANFRVGILHGFYRLLSHYVDHCLNFIFGFGWYLMLLNELVVDRCRLVSPVGVHVSLLTQTVHFNSGMILLTVVLENIQRHQRRALLAVRTILRPCVPGQMIRLPEQLTDHQPPTVFEFRQDTCQFTHYIDLVLTHHVASLLPSWVCVRF
jgi:hypothetical protein